MELVLKPTKEDIELALIEAKKAPSYQNGSQKALYGFAVEALVKHYLFGYPIHFEAGVHNDKGIDIEVNGVNYDIKTIGVPAWLKQFKFNINRFDQRKNYIITHYIDDSLDTIYLDGVMSGEQLLERGRLYERGEWVVTNNFSYQTNCDMVMIDNYWVQGKSLISEWLSNC